MENQSIKDQVVKEIERGIELLKLCQTLQSEKDSVNCPEPGLHAHIRKTQDQFARDIEQAISNMSMLRHLIPMWSSLARIGRLLEFNGEIAVLPGEDYGAKAIEHLEHKLDTSIQDAPGEIDVQSSESMSREEKESKVLRLLDDVDDDTREAFLQYFEWTKTRPPGTEPKTQEELEQIIEETRLEIIRRRLGGKVGEIIPFQPKDR